MSMSSPPHSILESDGIFDDDPASESGSPSATKVAGSEDASKNTKAAAPPVNKVAGSADSSKNTKAAAPPVNKVAGSADSSRNTKSTVKAPGGKDASRQKDGG